MGKLEKAIITNTGSGDRIPVLFNPEEYSLKRDINYAQFTVPGRSAPILQFVNGNLQTLEMDLLLDSVEPHREGGRIVVAAGSDIREQTRKLTGLMDIDPATHAPPVLLFAWSSLTFTCVLARATQQFLMFLADGTPVRARLQVTFNEFRNSDQEPREVKRETADFSRLHVFRDGETLSSIAAEAYGDPTQWRPIAIRNGIDVPAAVTVGAQLVIPSLPFSDPDTGEVFA